MKILPFLHAFHIHGLVVLLIHFNISVHGTLFGMLNFEFQNVFLPVD